MVSTVLREVRERFGLCYMPHRICDGLRWIFSLAYRMILIGDNELLGKLRIEGFRGVIGWNFVKRGMVIMLHKSFRLNCSVTAPTTSNNGDNFQVPLRFT